MKGLAVTSRGIEETACLEIRELINTECKIEESCIVFNYDKFEDLCLLSYKAQSIDRILYLIGDFKFDDFFKVLERFANKTNLDEWFKNHKNFKIECIRLGVHNFTSIDVEIKLSKLILDKYKNNKIKFNIKNYDINLFVYIVNNKCYFGIDFAGFELNKRGYKIFLHPSSLRGTIAYALIRESGFDKKAVMLDPFSRDGVIPIEAALYAANFPVNYYKKDKFAFLKLNIGINIDDFFSKTDKKIKKSKTEIYSFDHLFKHVDYSKKNAKIAGVDKHLNFSRTELEWLDIKFKEQSVDRIVTSLPVSKSANLEKIYNEFFYQAEYILKKNGKVGLILIKTDFVKTHAEKHNFIIEKEKDVWSGEQKLTIIVFKKKNI